MKSFTIALSALWLSDVTSLKVTPKAQARSKFISVMNQVSKERGLELDTRLSKKDLTKQILSRSKSESQLRKKRKVEEVVADDAVADDAAAADDAAVTDDAAAADDAASTDDAAASTDDAAEVYYDDRYDVAFGEDDAFDYSNTFFDLSNFSIKFHSCASLTALELEGFEDQEEGDDDDNNNNDGEEEEDKDAQVYPYTSTQVINFRLCPTDTCQDNSWKGCRNTYGNYMISLEDYFEAQEEYMGDVFEQYCDYCAQCEYMYKYFNAKCEYLDSCTEYGSACYEQEKEACEETDDDANNCDEEEEEEEEEDAVTYADFMECTEVDVLEDSTYYTLCSYCKQCDYMFSYFSAECKNYQLCSGYKNFCANDEGRRLDQQEADDDFSQRYYEEMQPNEKVFMKIYCDGSLKVGMFSDEQCSKYISDKVDMYETTGLSFTVEDLTSNYLTSDCISCSKKNTQYFHGYGNYQEQNNNNNNNNNGDDDEEDEMLEMCERIYEDSLKCNENLALDYSGDDDGKNGQYAEQWNETMSEKSCAYIEAVQMGEVDKYGYVSTSKYYKRNSDNYWNQKTEDFTNQINNKYMPRNYTLTQDQVTAVLVLFFCGLLYGIYACFFKPRTEVRTDLNVKLMKNDNGVSV